MNLSLTRAEGIGAQPVPDGFHMDEQCFKVAVVWVRGANHRELAEVIVREVEQEAGVVCANMSEVRGDVVLVVYDFHKTSAARILARIRRDGVHALQVVS